jgi:cellulose synthase/poly-beta-1,6-N-acetylglucosamine synthase-like glycosyltransferase
LAPNAVKDMLPHFDDPRVGAVAGKVYVVNTMSVISGFQGVEYITGQNIDKRLLSAAGVVNVVPGAIGAWRKDVVARIGGYSQDTMVEDQDLTLSIQSHGYKIKYEGRALAYTEAPELAGDFLKQRFRWVYGTLQCLWKYRFRLFSLERPALGWIILPFTLVFNFMMPLLAPVIDIVGLWHIFQGNWGFVVIAYNIFTLIDLTYSALGFIGEKKRSWPLLLLVPLQRVAYRFLISYSIIRSIGKALAGTRSHWNKLARFGLAQKAYQSAASHN